MEIEVREAVRADADAICDVHVASWRVAYRHIFPASILDADEFDSSRREIWRAWTHSLAADRRMLVGLLDDRVVGFAHAGHADESGTVGGEVHGFYTHPDAWGSGVASLMMDTALDHLRALGHAHAVVWTLGPAHRARAFYEKSGFVLSGRTDEWQKYPDHPVEDVEYTIDLRSQRRDA